MNFPVISAPVVHSRFEGDVVRGLSAERKFIPSQWFYDTRGSELFEDITRLPEYYLTRDEITLLRAHAPRIARCVGEGACVVEFGSGSSRKTPLLLRAMQSLRLYVPLDIAGEFLESSVRALRAELPGLPVEALEADLTDARAMQVVAQTLPAVGPRLGLFLGSSIGNFTRHEAVALMQRFAAALGPGSWLVIGVDSTRDGHSLVPAYDDAQGVTAAFNLNLLRRINDELAGSFRLENFRHEACFYPERDRVEMHLVSRMRQHASVSGREFVFEAGESIHTENCHKYTVGQFQALARDAGWAPVERWGEGDTGFGLHLLRHF